MCVYKTINDYRHSPSYATDTFKEVHCKSGLSTQWSTIYKYRRQSRWNVCWMIYKKI